MCTTSEANPLQQLRSALSGLADTDIVGLTDEQVRSALPQLLTAVNQLNALTAAMAGTFDARGLSDLDAYGSTRSWLTAVGRMPQGAATGWLHRARLLRELPALAEAATAGAASAEHVAKVKELADRLGLTEVKAFDQILADLASAANPADVAKACERIAAHLDPDGKPPDPEGDFAKREFTLSRTGSMIYVRGRLDPEAGAALHTALDALMKPPTGNDLRTPGQRRADALAELARLHLAQGQLPTVGGVRPQVGLLITPQMLLGHPTPPDPTATSDPAGSDPAASDPAASDPAASDSAASDEDGPGEEHRDCGEDHDEDSEACRGQDPLASAGVPPLPEPPWMGWVGEISPELAQRISCDCEVWRAILDPATGLPLEVGRAHRIVPPWIRKALHARDRGCRWPCCDVPAAWTDGHHLVPWYLGGRTDIDELLLLCRYHHSRIHEGGWRIELDPATGELRVYRPDGTPHPLGPTQPWLGPNRRRGDQTFTDGENGPPSPHADP